MLDYIINLENKWLAWIPKHKSFYVFLIILTGIFLGVGANLILNGSTRQGIQMAFCYTLIFVLTDFVAWGGE